MIIKEFEEVAEIGIAIRFSFLNINIWLPEIISNKIIGFWIVANKIIGIIIIIAAFFSL